MKANCRNYQLPTERGFRNLVYGALDPPQCTTQTPPPSAPPPNEPFNVAEHRLRYLILWPGSSGTAPWLSVSIIPDGRSGQVSLAGLGCVLPRGPGSGEGAIAHEGSPPLLSGGELGDWSRGAWLLAPWARWRRRWVGGVGGRWATGDLGPDVAGVLWRGVHCPSRLGPAEDPPLVTVFSEVPLLGEC